MKHASYIAFALCVFVFSASTALAQETSVETQAAADVSASTPVNTRAQTNRAIDMRTDIRARVQNANTLRVDFGNAIQNLRLDARNQQVDLRASTKTGLQGASSSRERRAILNNALQERSAIRDNRKASTSPLRADLKALARKHVGVIVGRFEAALKQFDSLVERIQTRIDKLEARGVDTASVEAGLSVAIEDIAQAKADVRTVVSLIELSDTSSDVETLRAEMNAAIREATASIKTAHGAFAKLARELVSLSSSLRLDVRATTTRQ